jgi:hypothetical protein
VIAERIHGAGLLAAALAVAGVVAPPSAEAGIVVVGGATPPRVAWLLPHEGAAEAEVEIVGQYLGDATAVDFGSTPAHFRIETSSWIVATAPAGSGTVSVSVTTPQGTSETSGIGDRFGYLASPLATPLPPAPAPAAVAATPAATGVGSPVTSTAPAEQEVTACVVPKLQGASLAVARRLLRAGHCKLGRVVSRPHRHRRRLVVVSQGKRVGQALAAGTEVSVLLGPARRRRRT